MKKNVFLTFTSMLAFTFFSLHANAETLQEAVTDALASSPRIESALADRAEALEKIREERSGYFPRINATATGGRIFGDNATSRGTVTTRGEAY